MAEETRTERPSNGHVDHHKACVRAAKEWEASALAPKAAEKAVQAFLLAVPLTAESTVLELGCGSGLCTALIARKVGAVLGLDRSKGLVKRFEAKAASLKLQDKMAAVRMELKDPKQLQDYLPDERGFDVVFSHRALRHLPDFSAALGVLLRVLRPGGWLFVTDLESAGDVAPQLNGNHQEHVVREGLSGAELERGLQAAGLVDVSVGRSFSLDDPDQEKGSETTWYLGGVGRKPCSSALR
ncbi:hypothetical protein KFL_005730080 [Klebsormidium nitens]|uniref:Methyltransferase domain-containing protein n=1 Tax=Klebsormidium nitens TaxID=105231 RepID=A0A0U9HME4_KLENI|nr:hypothetical protein KFL_005730080 [Klebsormidium nitens]|eukprot:GAQ89887.1 hypothetical protein KFL_005730080 [Klebsormidium nitens]